ncbi:MAG: DUF4920 domain-containing protein [Planctomycetes bacterium]|nr:DUF4920 domain-containing protein [Planctomycetota bacterium]
MRSFAHVVVLALVTSVIGAGCQSSPPEESQPAAKTTVEAKAPAAPAAPAAVAVPGGAPAWHAGLALGELPATPVAVLNAKEKDYMGKSVKVAGVVTRVCQGSGCWVEVKDGDGLVIAKSLDHVVLFPKDCAGKKVVLMGVLRESPKQEECKHDHQGVAAHECPRPPTLIEVQGASLF